MYPRDEAVRDMIAAARSFYEFGWLLGTSGNLSVRLSAESFLITASGRNKGELTASDFLECDGDGKPLVDDSPKPSAETRVHVELYRKFSDIGAIYHVHEPYAALCSDTDIVSGATSFEKVEMIKGLDIWRENARISVPIVENHHEIPKLARAVAEVADEALPAVMVCRHGFYAWGATPHEARRHVETLAYLYRYSWERRRGR